MIGIDMEKLSRFERMRQKPESLAKLLTERERRYWDGKENALSTLAGFWCAKESVVKALGTGFGTVSYLDVEIRHDAFGQPTAYVPKLGLTFEVAISHTDDACVAVAMRV